jgi:hypothetical protein
MTNRERLRDYFDSLTSASISLDIAFGELNSHPTEACYKVCFDQQLVNYFRKRDQYSAFYNLVHSLEILDDEIRTLDINFFLNEGNI